MKFRWTVSVGILYLAALLAVEGSLAYLDWTGMQGLAQTYGSDANIPGLAMIGEAMPQVRALALQVGVFGLAAAFTAAAILLGKPWAKSVAFVLSLALALSAGVIGYLWPGLGWRQAMLVFCCALYWWAYHCELRKDGGNPRRVPLFLWSVLGVAASSLLSALLMYLVEYFWPAYSGLGPDSELARFPIYFSLGVAILAIVTAVGRLSGSVLKSRHAALAVGWMCGLGQAIAGVWRLGIRTNELFLLLALVLTALLARMYLGRRVLKQGERDGAV